MDAQLKKNKVKLSLRRSLIYVYNQRWKEVCRSDLSSYLPSIWRRYVYAGYQFGEGTLSPLDFPSP